MSSLSVIRVGALSPLCPLSLQYEWEFNVLCVCEMSGSLTSSMSSVSVIRMGIWCPLLL
jgi:hypothetical protein